MRNNAFTSKSKPSAHTLRSCNNYSLIPALAERFKKSFFPSTVAEWNDLDTDLRNTQSLFAFKVGIRTLYRGNKYNEMYDISMSRFNWLYIIYMIALGQCQLNSYLYKINCKPSSFCNCTRNVVTHNTKSPLHTTFYTVAIRRFINCLCFPVIWC